MNYKKVLGLLAIGLIVLVAMVLFIGPGQIFEALKKANVNYVILAVLLQFVIMGLWTVRWGLIASGLDIQFSKIPLFAMLLVGLAVNNITPSGRGGGEPVRAYLLSRSSGKSFDSTFATVMGDKLFDTGPFVVLAICALLYLIFGLHMSFSLYVTLIVALILFVAFIAFIFYICINEEIGTRVIRWIFNVLDRFLKRDVRKYESKALTALAGFQRDLKYLMRDKSLFIKAVLVSFLVWFLELLRVYIVFLAFGTKVSLGMIAAVFLVSTFVGMVPALPGGIGAIDGLMILLYSMAGIPPSVSTAATLIERGISFWMVSVLGLLMLPYFGTGVLDEVNI